MENKTAKDLLKLNVNEHTEKKNKLTYLSWAWAWSEALNVDPDVSYQIEMLNDKPYTYDENLGYMVYTTVTMFGQTKSMQLPVMDGANKAMKNIEYTYEVKDYATGGTKQKKVEPATMFDINTAIMRCMTKNLALFGLGLYIYAGEDLPQGESKGEQDISIIDDEI